MNDQSKALLAVLLASIIGGGLSVFGKIARTEIPAFSFTFLRFAIAFLFLLPFVYGELKKHKKSFGKLFLISLFATGNVVFFALGIPYTSATMAQVLYMAVPAVVAVLSYLILHEKIRSSKILGIMLGLMGAGYVVVLPLWEKGGGLGGGFMGNIIISVGIITFSLYSVFSKPLQKTFSPMVITAGFALTATISQIPFLAIDFSMYPDWWSKLTMKGIGSLLYVALLGTVIYYAVHQYAIKHATPLVASMILYLQPIATYALAALFLGEQLTVGFLIGAGIVIAGTILTTKKA